ncbi:MAG: carbohydrate ABC transporter permease [Rhodopila sp.]|nr:carbohydrate ABC transporter permease [Rhodopila sp.]
MSVASRARLDRRLVDASVAMVSVVLIIWTIVPLYNMVRVALQEKEDVFSNSVFPTTVTWHSFETAFRESYWLLANFWGQMGTSFYIGVSVAFLTLAIGTLTSFTISRMKIRRGWMLTNAALLTYMIPMSFLAIPFYSIMGKYGLTDNPLSVIAVEVTFATPYAIFIFKQYGASIPQELDEAARIDGASPPQIFFRIYLPLMAPALVAIGTYALLLSWNEYLYAFLLLSSDGNITVPVGLGKFLNSDEAPWNYLMAAAIIYALPPMAIYYAFRRKMNSGLTMGGVKG